MGYRGTKTPLLLVISVSSCKSASTRWVLFCKESAKLRYSQESSKEDDTYSAYPRPVIGAISLISLKAVTYGKEYRVDFLVA